MNINHDQYGQYSSQRPNGPFCTKDLCRIYNVSRKTMNKWLGLFRDELGPKRGMYYTNKQARLIFEELGDP